MIDPPETDWAVSELNRVRQQLDAANERIASLERQKEMDGISIEALNLGMSNLMSCLLAALRKIGASQANLDEVEEEGDMQHVMWWIGQQESSAERIAQLEGLLRKGLSARIGQTGSEIFEWKNKVVRQFPHLAEKGKA